MKKKLWCSELMQKKNKKFKLGVLNNLNGNAGSGKTDLLLKYMFENPLDFIETKQSSKYNTLSFSRNRVLYVTDTTNLKQQMLTKYNCIELKQGVLKEYVNSDFNIEDLAPRDKIVTCTYSTLGYYLQNDKFVEWFIKHFYVIIFDESHNLIKWHYQFDNVENSSYCYIVNNLKCFVDNTLLICASATNEYLTNYFKSYHSEGENAIEVNTIFTEQELNRELKRYENKETKYYINMDMAYQSIIERVKQGSKALIWETQIKTIKKLEKYFKDNGLNVLCIWSKNNSKHPMSEEQINSIDYVLENEQVEDKYDIVIINDATTTGVNIKSKAFEISIINSTKNEVRVQARNRLRKNIELLILPYWEDIDGFRALTKCVDFINEEPKEIDPKYLNKHLSKEEQRFLINKYCPSYCDKNYDYFIKEKSWRKFKEYLVNWGYEVKENYIFKEGDERNMLENYLEELIDKRLYKEQQEELINRIDLRVDGHQQKSISKLNKGLEMLGIILKIKSKRVTENGKKITIWYIE